MSPQAGLAQRTKHTGYGKGIEESFPSEGCITCI